MESYDPWRALGQCGQATLVYAPLPAGQRGRIDFRTKTITLRPDLRAAERTCTLTHELVHLERGPVLLRLTAREERRVAEIAACRLIPLPALLATVRWARNIHELAEELAVDVRTVRVRLRNLTDAERLALAQSADPEALAA